MRKETVIVTKCKAHRIGIAVFSIAMLTVLTVCVAAMHTPAAILLYMPVLTILSPIALYYLTWQIRFDKKSIVRYVFGRKARIYSFTMLRDVVKRYYVSERNITVRMHFIDGKVLQFRMDDENAAQAVRILQRHCSIRNP